MHLLRTTTFQRIFLLITTILFSYLKGLVISYYLVSGPYARVLSVLRMFFFNNFCFKGSNLNNQGFCIVFSYLVIWLFGLLICKSSSIFFFFFFSVIDLEMCWLIQNVKYSHFIFVKHTIFLNVRTCFDLFIYLALSVLVVACGIYFPDGGSNLGPLHWEHRVLATGQPGMSQNILFLKLHFKYLIMKFIQIYPFLCLQFQP